jgi:hypothetical protein
VGLLALTGDPRAIPVLRRGLLSPNYQIEIIAALGLADFVDKGSIPLIIIEACSKAPAEAAAAIAEALVYFGSDSEPSARLWNEPGALIRLTAPCVALFRFRNGDPRFCPKQGIDWYRDFGVELVQDVGL